MVKPVLAWLCAAAALLCSVERSEAAPAAAADGEQSYQTQCASCHMASLAGGGGFAPPLKGKAFVDKWSSQGWTRLRDYISTTMPPSNPRGLSPATYDQITRHILKANGVSDAGGVAAPAASSVAESILAESRQAVMGGAAANKDLTYRRAIERRHALVAGLRPVTEEMLRNPPAEDWLQYRRTDDSHGFSPLRQINAGNVGDLGVAWTRSLTAGRNGITPLVHQGVMFINSAGTVLALDASTGEKLWAFERRTGALGAVSQPRGMAIHEDRLIVPTLDNHVLALDVATGDLIWDYTLPNAKGLYFSAAPIVVRGKVLQGVSGCWIMVEPRGCRVVALDARTGKEAWSLRTIPASGEAGGDSWNGAPTDQRFGAAIWAAGSYSPDTGLVYFGTSQTYRIERLMAPNHPVGPGNAALHTNSTLAIDPDTGKLVWSYQHLQRDIWDLDWAYERLLLTVNVKGRPRLVVATMGKVGIADILDAKTGQYLFSFDTGMQDLVVAIDPATGQKTINPSATPAPGQATRICPYSIGVRNWPAASYDAGRGALFASLTSSCMEFTWKRNQADDSAMDILMESRPNPDRDGANAKVASIDLAGRRYKWSTPFRAPQSSAALATAGGIVFTGGSDRAFRAFDSDSGRVLWTTQVDNLPSSSPISFAVSGTQYVAVVTGGGSPNDLGRAALAPELEPAGPGVTLWVYKLGKTRRDR